MLFAGSACGLLVLPVGKSLVDGGKSLRMGCDMTAEAKFLPPSRRDHSAGEVDHLLDYRLDPAPLRLMADKALAADQSCLAHEAQDVVHQSAAGHAVANKMAGQSSDETSNTAHSSNTIAGSDSIGDTFQIEIQSP